MAEMIPAQVHQDIEDIGKAVNTDAIITPRYGAPFKSLPMIAREIYADVLDLRTNKADKSDTYTKLEVDSALSLKAPQSSTYTKAEVDTTFAAYVGGRKAFTTLALAQAGQSTLTANTVVDVTNDPDPAKNGTYQWNGTTLTKSAYDPETVVRTKVLNTFKTKTLMDASALPDGADAQVTDDTVNNGLYVKTAGAWVKSSYDPVGVASKITSRMLGHLESSLVDVSSNLYNPQEALLNKYADPSTGEITDSTTSFHITGKIPVSIGDYTISADSSRVESFRNVVFYDYNDNFVKGSAFSSGSNPLTINVSDANISYMILSMRQGMPEDYERMINKGSEALPYEPYYKVFKDVTLSESQIEQVIESIDITDSAKPYLDNIDSYNLFNPFDVTEGYMVDMDTGQVVKDDAYFVTGFIPVKPSTYYGISQDIGVNAFRITSYYDESKQHINSRLTTTSVSGFYAWRTPANAAYVRLSSNWKGPEKYNRMFFEGNEAKPYVSGVPTLERVKLSENIMEQINREVNVSSDIIPYVFDRNLDDIFGLSEGYSGFEDWGGRTAAEVYTLYDELADNNSGYITKYDMQPDLLGNEIAYYKLSPAKPLIGQESRLPVVVLNAGIHGHEKAATLSTYLFIKLLCEGWRDNPVLEAMRYGVVFYILPISNPSGWNANTRKNHNGVDINRNFPYKWDNKLPPDNVRYGGPSAASEVETQNIMAMLEDAGDIDIFYDHHNFQASLDRYLWVSIGGTNNRLLERMSQSFISRMTNKWRKEYDWIPQDESWFAGYSDTGSTPSQGVLGNYARFEVGVLVGSTFEVCDNWAVNSGLTKYGVELTKTGVEALVNWLAINLVNIHHYRG